MSNFHFINKNAESNNLSRSEDAERTHLYRHVQRRALIQRRWSSPQYPRLEHTAGPSAQLSPSQAFRYDPIHSNTDQYELQLPQTPADNRLVYGSRLLDAFIDRNIHALANQDDYLDIQSFFWIKNLSPLFELGGPALGPSIVALAAAGLGQTDKDVRLIQGATVAYGEAIASLSNTCALADDRTFAACLSLVMYQYFAESPDRRHLFLHTRGLSAILQTRGPYSFQEGLAHDLFTSCRAVLISSSLHSRKASFIAEVEWRTIPWQTKPKSSYEQMLDCLSLIPQIGQNFSIAQRAYGHDVENVQQHLSLITNLWNAISTLHSWFLSVVETAKPTSVTHTHLPCLLDPAPHILTFPTSYQYRSLAKSNMCRLFWAALTDLYNMLALTYETLAQQGIYPVSPEPARQYCRPCVDRDPNNSHLPTTNHHSHYFCTAGAAPPSSLRPFPLPGPDACTSILLAFACRTFARTAAEQVCMSLQYCISPDHGTVGKYLSIIPLKFAVWCFTINLPSTSAQLAWARRAVRALADSGVPFSAKLFCDRPYRPDRADAEAETP